MTGESAHTASKEMRVPRLMFPSECAPAINYLLQSEVGITLCFQVCSACTTHEEQ